MARDLNLAIEHLYATFAHYPLDSPAPCPTCYPAEEVLRIERRLRTQPLRLLTLDDLSHFYGDGVLTWGGVDDFRHLLPRLMELFAAAHLGMDVEWSGDEIQLRIDLTPDIALLRFVHAEWWTWPQVEQQAIDEFFQALWAEYLGTGDEPLLADEWMDEELAEAILRVMPDPAPYLEMWRSADWPGTRHLAWFIHGNQVSHWLRWEDDTAPSTMPKWERVRKWLDEPATAAQLEAAARVSAPRDMAWEALLGLEVLERGRPAVRMWGGQWLWDATSAARAASLGIELPPLPDDAPSATA